MSLVVISTHPIQYHAPVYRYLQQRLGIPTTVIYGSDQGLARYHDKEFNADFAWDVDLLSGYKSFFLRRIGKKNDSGSPTVEQIIDKAQPTMVLILGYATRLYLRAWVCAKKLKLPVLFRMEAYDEFTKNSGLRHITRDIFLRSIYKHTDSFLYIGKAAYRHYQRLGVSEDKLFFSPYVVDPAPFQVEESDRENLRESKRKSLGVGAGDIVILFSGKFIVKKNPLLILKALQSLPIEFQRKVVLLYLGDGPLKSQLCAESQRIKDVRVAFCGFKNQTELSPVYHSADVLVLPSSFNETWGLVVNEALAHGLPCIVSDHVGCHEDLIDTGVNGEVFKVGSANALAEAIQKLLTYYSYPETRKKCREKISRYTVDNAAAGISQAYHYLSF